MTATNTAAEQLQEQLEAHVRHEARALERLGSGYLTDASDEDAGALDVELVIGHQRHDYRRGILLIAVGGPLIWAETNGHDLVTVYGQWGNAVAEYQAVADGLDDAIEGLFASR